MKRFLRSLLIATALLLGATTARAEILFYVSIDHPVSFGNADLGVSFLYGASGMNWADVGVPTLLGEHSSYAITHSTPGAQPVTFNDAFTLKVWFSELYDEYDPPKEGSLEFRGRLTGTLSKDASTVRLTFPNQTRTVNVGPYDYSVRPFSVDIPPPGSDYIPLSVELTVKVAQAPEPSALALVLLGAAGLSARRWLRRRRPE